VGGRTFVRVAIASTVVTMLLQWSVPASAAPGDLDPTFGRGGRTLTRFPPGQLGTSDMAIQPDGRILVSGGDPFFVARYRPNGSLDPSFSADGRIHTDFSYGGVLTSDAHGGVVVAGEASPQLDNRVQWEVLRYDSTGRLDPSFGDDGRITIGFTRRMLGSPPGWLDTGIRDALITSDGRIVLVGSIGALERIDDTDTEIENDYNALAGVNADGSLDETFGAGGRVIRHLDGPGWISATMLLPDNGILVSEDRNGAASKLVEFSPNGSFRGRFADDSDRWDLHDLGLAPDGSVVGVGMTYLRHQGGRHAWLVVRYRHDGSIDGTFDGDGIVATPFGRYRWNCYAAGVAVQPDGRIVVTGSIPKWKGPDLFGILRYRAGGNLDRSFGGDGRVFTDILQRRRFEDASATTVALQTDEKIVAVGFVRRRSQENARWVVARYLAS
jgi:uncharacterized delta-60 repeat protein